MALGNGRGGPPPLQTVVGVEKGVAPVAVTTIAPPGVTLEYDDDWKRDKKGQIKAKVEAFCNFVANSDKFGHMVESLDETF